MPSGRGQTGAYVLDGAAEVDEVDVDVDVAVLVSTAIDVRLPSDAELVVSIGTLEVVVALTVMLRLGEEVGEWSSPQSHGSVP